MASDEAIRERSRAWSGGWLSHRLAAAQHLASEPSDDVNKAYKPAAPRPSSGQCSVLSSVSHSVDQPTGCQCAPIIAGLFAVPVPEPFNLWIPEPCAHSP
ncbi:hypothetical protein TYRP_017533 [Tyrophagus putrescentiae]|nr:hypothetical protein TYRP_017533 [Tyrophagus putrescentiae]